MRILLIRLRLIGDVVFTTPIPRALKRAFPDAHLTYLVEPAAAAVVRDNPNLDEVIVAPPPRGLERLAPDRRQPRLRRGPPYDVEIDADELGIAEETDVRVLNLVTVQRGDGAAHLTANLRAPLVVDVRRRVLHQVILADSRWAVSAPFAQTTAQTTAHTTGGAR